MLLIKGVHGESSSWLVLAGRITLMDAFAISRGDIMQTKRPKRHGSFDEQPIPELNSEAFDFRAFSVVCTRPHTPPHFSCARRCLTPPFSGFPTLLSQFDPRNLSAGRPRIELSLFTPFHLAESTSYL